MKAGWVVFQAFWRGVLVFSVMSAYLVSFKKSGSAWNAGPKLSKLRRVSWC